MLLSNISWETYERLLQEMGETHYRVTFDEGELEVMTLSLGHENWGEWIGHLILIVAMELDVALLSGGSTTLKKSLRRKGLEPDKCYWIKHEELMRGKKEWDALADPPPDLGVEVDVTSSSLDRMAIYAALQVPEVWRFDGEEFQVLILGPNGKYKEKSRSVTFPSLPLQDFAAFVKMLGSANEVSLLKQFTAWVRTAVLPKPDGSGAKKNGRKP